MNEYATIDNYINHVMREITERDVEQVSDRLRSHGWEKVVRCRDCEFFNIDEFGGYCTLFDFGDVNKMENKFCAWAERKDDNHA